MRFWSFSSFSKWQKSMEKFHHRQVSIISTCSPLFSTWLYRVLVHLLFTGWFLCSRKNSSKQNCGVMIWIRKIRQTRRCSYWRKKMIRSSFIDFNVVLSRLNFSPESQGVVAACIFLVLMFIMIAIVFSEHLHPQSDFPHNKVRYDENWHFVWHNSRAKKMNHNSFLFSLSNI